LKPSLPDRQERQNMLNNENGLVPVTGGRGRRRLKFEFPDIRVGIAEYEEGPTGCTVLHFPTRAHCEVDVRGGAPGLFGGYGYADAICFAGGSLYGLESAAGVAAEILDARQDVSWGNIACVSGAIIYDFTARRTLCYPDKTLGRAAFRAAVEGSFPLGRQGAGRSATVGKIAGSRRFKGEPGGQGAAVDALGSLTVAVFTVVNSLGAVIDEDGSVLRGYRDRESGERLHLHEIIERFPAEVPPLDGPETGGNTTLSAVVVNQRLPPHELRQLARQVHAAMARVIQPFHTIRDGDIMFALSAGEEPPNLNVVAIGEFASSLAAKAVRAAVAS
jgi:L-aminopeptidase/D-esterase-like protein